MSCLHQLQQKLRGRNRRGRRRHSPGRKKGCYAQFETEQLLGHYGYYGHYRHYGYYGWYPCYSYGYYGGGCDWLYRKAVANRLCLLVDPLLLVHRQLLKQ